MTRRDGLISVIESLHAEIAAMKANDVAALERATRAKLVAIEALARVSTARRPRPRSRELAEEAQRLNETVPHLRQSDGGKRSPPPANSCR